MRVRRVVEKREEIMEHKTIPVERPVRPVFEHGFWWWYDPKRNGWFVGTAPQIQKPTWAA